MRQDDLYNPAPVDRQLALTGCGEKGEALMAKMADWMEMHPSAYEYMRQHAIRLAKRDGIVSVKYLLELCRNERHVSIPNALAPALARYMEVTNPNLLGGRFKKHRSCVDGFWPTLEEAGDE